MCDNTVSSLKLLNKDTNFNLHPCFPYAHNIYNKIADDGIFKTAILYIFSSGFSKGFLAIFETLFFKRFQRISKIVINHELKNIDKSKIKSIGLLNIATDFLVASRRADILKDFYLACKSLKLEVFFYTANPIPLYDLMNENDILDGKIVLHYNEKGFKVFPSLEKVINLVNNSNIDIYGMSVFNGIVKDPYKFVKDSNLTGVIFGSSNANNIKKNIKGFS